MPRVWKTVVPRIRRSLREQGLARTLRRGIFFPARLWREYRAAGRVSSGGEVSEFDRAHGVKTDGEFQEWTYLSDLEIPSPNWIEGNDYLPIEPERFERVLGSLDVKFEEFTFIDFGSGMGRALLLASEFPFQEIIGLEFAPELHRAAEENIRRYRSPTQKCSRMQSIRVDFADFVLPERALVLFFFDPCRGRVLEGVTAKIVKSLLDCPRPVYVVYVARRPEAMRMFAESGVLEEICRDEEWNFCIYRSNGAGRG